MFLFALSELLEALSLGRARRAIQSLLKLTPETALLKRGEKFEEVPVEQVEIGNVVEVKSGSRVPLDGEVVSGNSAVNQAPITGESMPVEKQRGDTVFAGTINGEGSLEVRVTKPHTDTMLARIIHLVEQAQSQKAPSQRFVDVFAKYYTPAVFCLALLVWLAPPLAFGGAWLVWTYRALVLLVIACPCALVISTPVSVVSGLTAMARRGVLIKGGAVLEAVGKLNALATDKTGTITEGKPRVTSIVMLNSKPEMELLRIAAAIDAHSEHPLAQAVVNHAMEEESSFRAVGITAPRAVAARKAKWTGMSILSATTGSPTNWLSAPKTSNAVWPKSKGGRSPWWWSGTNHTATVPGEVLGVLAVGDAIRPGAQAAVRSLTLPA